MIFQALKEDEGKKKLKVAAIIAGILFLVAAVGGGLAYQNSQAEAEKKLAADRAAAQAEMEKRERDMKRLEAMLADAESMGEAQKAALQAELEKAKKAAAEAAVAGGAKKTTGASTYRPGKPKPRPAAAKPACPPGDPMCGGL